MPFSGQSYDFFSGESGEFGRLGVQEAIMKGRMIQHPGEAIISVDFSEKFGVLPGDTVTFFGSTMYGSMTFSNYTVAGIVRFGTAMLDKGAVIIDLSDARQLLDMEDAAGALFGFLPDGYVRDKAEHIKNTFHSQYAVDTDE